MKNKMFYEPKKTLKKIDKPILEIYKITKFLCGKCVINDINLEIYEGEIFALLGASGSGKSTLLRIIAGFETPHRGNIFLNKNDLLILPPYQRPVNMMFQSYALFPHMTIEQNIAFGLKQENLKKIEIYHRVEQILSLVHMSEYAKRKPHQLSGGQCQRVALARSLVKKPKLLLLDEPMSALDKKFRKNMQLELIEIIKTIGVTCIIVTHDPEEAMTMATRIGIMNEGKIEQIGKPEEIYERPISRYSAEFIGAINIFQGYILETLEEFFLIDIPKIDTKFKIKIKNVINKNLPLYVAIRPEKIMFCENIPSNTYNFVYGKIVHIIYLGNCFMYYFKLKNNQVISTQLKNVNYKNLLQINHEGYIYWEIDSCIILHF